MTDTQKTEQEVAIEAAEAKAKEVNDARTGKGTRVKVGQTRGRNPQVVSFENFDEGLIDSLPVTLAEFAEITKTPDESTLVKYAIAGYNDAMYVAASDPIAEFVNPAWDDDAKKAFRIVVRNYAQNANSTIEDAVAIIKPGIEAAQAKLRAEGK